MVVARYLTSERHTRVARIASHLVIISIGKSILQSISLLWDQMSLLCPSEKDISKARVRVRRVDTGADHSAGLYHGQWRRAVVVGYNEPRGNRCNHRHNGYGDNSSRHTCRSRCGGGNSASPNTATGNSTTSGSSSVSSVGSSIHSHLLKDSSSVERK